MIKLSHLNKTYGLQPVLQDVSLSIEAGDIFGIVGESGAGKSTLLRSINLLERPDSGEVWINQQNLMQLQPKALRKTRHQMGMIFQHFNLLDSKTVFENIALPIRIQGCGRKSIDKSVNELLDLVGLSHKAHQYPAQLSGGQKQRVAIARALSTQPNVLLCDEPTSALDPENNASILALLKSINETLGVTIVLITHEMNVVKQLAHHVALMSKGKIVETLTLNQLFVPPLTPLKSQICDKMSPKLPECLAKTLTHDVPNNPSQLKVMLRLFFQNDLVTGPIMSELSRNLSININILLANIERLDELTCGVMIVELESSPSTIHQFKTHCQSLNIIVETLGYVLHQPT